MQKLSLLASTLAFAGVSTGVATAQELKYNPSVYVAPYASFFNPDNQFGTNATGGGGGLKLGKAINRWMDLQVGVGYARAAGDDTRIQQATAGIDAVFYPTRDRLRPYLGIGVGAENDRRNIPNRQNSRTSPYASAALGLQYVISDQWATNIEYRRVFEFQRSDVFEPDRRTQNNYVNVGLTYFLGKTPEAAPRVAQAAPPPPPPPAPPPPPPPPRFEKRTFSSTELFGFDSATLRQPQPKLDEIAGVLQANPDVSNVRISGYTDRLGKDAYNQKLSQRRADAVKTYLVGKGVAGSRLDAVGKGKSDPVVQCDEKNRTALIKCLEPNRRVEVEEIVVEKRVQ